MLMTPRGIAADLAIPAHQRTGVELTALRLPVRTFRRLRLRFRHSINEVVTPSACSFCVFLPVETSASPETTMVS